MRRRLPSLAALQAFEASARRLSYTRAAEELNVTLGAVSYQVRALEEWLGVRLFQRQGNALALTSAGETYLAGITTGLENISEVTEQLAMHDAHNNLTVVAPPSFSSKWLIPRLGSLFQQLPQLNLRIVTVSQPIDFSQHILDVGIGFGWEIAPGFQRWPWLTYELFPVRSPVMHNPPASLESPADLASVRLIHDDALRIHDRIDWRVYFDMAGVRDVDAAKGLHFNRALDAYQAAIDGHGVVLAKSALVQRDMAAGRLERLFDLSVPSEFTYDIVGTEPRISSPKAKAFCQWLSDEARADGMLAPNAARFD